MVVWNMLAYLYSGVTEAWPASGVDIPWYCAICACPNSRTIFDLHGVDWSDSTLLDLSLSPTGANPTDQHFQPQHTSTPTRSSQQDRPLRLVNVNFQSASGKRSDIPNLISSLKSDMILG
eukprot:TRINITY_DN21479_c0_g1_i5.p1 TRINITY_DN21479_c0_g1~~TRINITY_DN21479_c0_g1_i5.p1  ORF type:complete len:120 (+),score=15.65 TRINITY_DN21479_c0_g1_i5:224-583(+)